MSLTKGPSKEEVIAWGPEKLADYMRQLKICSCDNVVLKGGITGAQFMNMTQHELKVFPIVYVPILGKIQQDLKRRENRNGFGSKSKTQSHSTEVQAEKVWDSNEFASESDEYEFNEEPGQENYIEPHMADNPHNARAREDHSFQPAFSHLLKPPEPKRMSKVHTAQLSNFQWATNKKPEKPPLPRRAFSHLTEGSVDVATASSPLASRRPLPIVPQRISSNRANNPNPHVPVPTQHVQLNQSIRTSRQNLDPIWYRGRITRNQAEFSLREVNKDGAFLVRDSLHASTQHPYTLMLLNQGKIYNIKIQRQNDFYFLGNGVHSTKSFLRVKEMIIHHMNTPLLLIDAIDQCSEEQPQCCLLHPAGL